MKIIQSRSFEQRIKKFNKVQKKALDEQIKLILGNPDIGNEKKGVRLFYNAKKNCLK